MADDKKQRRPRLPKNPALDARIQARRQKEIDGFVERYDEILQKREALYGAEVLPTWKRIGADLSRAITDLYNTYATPEGLLDATRLNELERLQFLRQHATKMIHSLEGQEGKITNNLAYTYTESYYFHAFGLEQAARLQVLVPALTHSHVLGVLANPWLPDGRTYSDRLRANTAYLAEKMRQGIESAVALGWGANETGRHIQAIAGEGYHNAVRLARTELNRAASQGSSHLYMQNADILDAKRWRATLDAKTAPKDADNDGKQYTLEYDTPEMPGEPGQRIPNHPHCRCKYSPVLASLGAREGERIARGEGATPENFGERTYTKAATYREYAKERGLPDLDERLRNDDPRRYLRADERGQLPPVIVPPAAALVVPLIPAPAAAAAAKTPKAKKDAWVDEAKQLIAAGLGTEEQVRKLGAVIRKQAGYEKLLPKQEKKAKLAAQSKTLYREYEQLKVQLANASGQGRGKIMARMNELAKIQPPIAREVTKMHEELGAEMRKRTLSTISKLRPMGTSKRHTFYAGSEDAAKKLIDDAMQMYPTEWLEKSIDYGVIQAKIVERGWHQDMGSYSQIFISGPTENQRFGTAVHELAHRFEDAVPGLKAIEKQFYERRTAGDTLEQLNKIVPGSGYRDDEVTKRDKFDDFYMGKYYGEKAYEVLSMGFESLYADTYRVTKDEDLMDLLLGVLGGK